MIILSLFLTGNSNAGDIGTGELKMEDWLVDYFQKYIKIRGGQSPETFVVAIDGSSAMYWYCPTGNCRAGGDNAKLRQCEVSSGGIPCKTFARGRTIKWKNGINPGKGRESQIKKNGAMKRL